MGREKDEAQTATAGGVFGRTASRTLRRSAVLSTDCPEVLDCNVGLRVLDGNNEDASDAPVGLLDLTITDIWDVDVGLRGLIEDDRRDGFVDCDKSVGLLGLPES